MLGDRKLSAFRGRKLGFVFQFHHLLPEFTALENVMMAPKLLAKEREDFKQNKAEIFKEIEENAKRLLNRAGLSDKYKNYPCELSGGQQQRVALARMIAARPGIFMFDEPFSALDSYLKSSLEQTLLDMLDLVKTTVLYVSHDIDESFRFCDRICVISDGHVAEIGPTKQIVGMTFHTNKPIPDDLAYLGIRAFYVHPADAEKAGGKNAYRLQVHRTSDSRFERSVMLKTPEGGKLIQWKVDKLQVPEDKLPKAGDVINLHFDADKLYLVRA